MQEPTVWTAADTRALLHAPTARSDKYTRGVVGMCTGSVAYPGAAVLGVEAAWRTGVGMVRYVGPGRAADLVLARRPETVLGAGRVQAWVVGSGTDVASRTSAEAERVRGLLAGDTPVVVDAGALPDAVDATAPRVVTPHAREHDVLRGRLGLAPAGAGADAVRQTASALGAAVLRKGATTVVAAPSGWTACVSAATPWLAAAGTGDVLAGVLGALIAVDAAGGPVVDADRLARLAAAAAWLHGRAGVAASGRCGGGPITALDVAAALPGVVATVLAS